MGIDRKFLCVLLLGLAFMLIFTAFQTWGNIQATIIDSMIKDENFEGKPYISMAIIYAVMALFNWSAPSVINMIGPNFAMLFGGITYVLFILSFLLAQTWALYVMSTIIGIGAAMIWTGQGNYLSLNSDQQTISRNSGIFWAMLQMSMFIGNLYVYFAFQGKSHVDKDTRTTVIWVLSGIAIAGLVVIILLPRIKKNRADSLTQPSLTPLESLKGAWNLFWTSKMLLLSTTFFYTGIELGFFSGVYSNAIGFTNQFPSPKELVGLSGILIGIGEVLGGLVFGILGSKTVKYGRDPIVIFGFVVHIISFILIFLNLPNNSPFKETDDTAIITSNAPLAIFCSFLLGLGDACFNTQIYSILGGYYAEDSASAFAIFKFVQSVAAAANFFYASDLVLYGQLGILFALAIVGTICFVKVEWSIKKEKAMDGRGGTLRSNASGSSTEEKVY